MKKLLLTFLLGVGVAASLFAALSYHFILTRDGMVIERKKELTFTDTFVDTRQWGPFDYLRNPGIASALARDGMDELGEAAREAREKAVEESKDLLDRSRKAFGDALEKAGRELKK